MPPRAIKKPPTAVAPIVRTPNSCPHCKVGVLEETTVKQKDTAQKDITIWECTVDVCGYTEGR